MRALPDTASSLIQKYRFLWLNAISVGGTVIGMGLGYLYHFLSARALTLEEYGVLGLLVGIWSSLTLPLSAITSVLVRELAHCQSEPERADFLLVKYLKKFGLYSAAFALVAALASYLCGQPLLALLLLGFPFMVVVAVAAAWLQVRERILGLTLVQQGQNALKVLALLLFLSLGWGLAGAALALPAYAFALLVILLVWLYPKIGPLQPVKLSLRSAFALLLAWQVLSQVMLYEDLFAVSHFLGDAPAGLYNAAEITAKILVFLAIAIGLVLLPKIAKLPKNEVRAKGLPLLGLSMALLVPVFIGFQFLAEPFLMLFFGAKFAGSVPPFLALSWGMLLAGWAQLIGLFLLARGEDKMLALSFGGAVMFNALVQYAVVPAGGLVGAAWGTTLSCAVLLAMMLVLLARKLSFFTPARAQVR